MTNYEDLSVYRVNAFLWQKLQDAGILNENDYIADGFNEPLIPIIPAQQIPEFNNLLPGKTYILYDYETKPFQEHFWISEESITYTILSQNYDKINKILNFMTDNFRRFDETARDVNSFLQGKDSPFDYHYLYVDGVMSPQHFQNEGGFMLGEVIVYTSYVRDLDSDKRFL